MFVALDPVRFHPSPCSTNEISDKNTGCIPLLHLLTVKSKRKYQNSVVGFSMLTILNVYTKLGCMPVMLKKNHCV